MSFSRRRRELVYPATVGRPPSQRERGARGGRRARWSSCSQSHCTASSKHEKLLRGRPARAAAAGAPALRSTPTRPFPSLPLRPRCELPHTHRVLSLSVLLTPLFGRDHSVLLPRFWRRIFGGLRDRFHLCSLSLTSHVDLPSVSSCGRVNTTLPCVLGMIRRLGCRYVFSFFFWTLPDRSRRMLIELRL